MKLWVRACATLSAVILFANASVAGDGASKPKIHARVGMFYFPNAEERGTKTFRPNEAILHRPTVWGLSAKIDRTVTLATSDGPASIEAGTVLPAVEISGLPGTSTKVIAFCTVVQKQLSRFGASQFGVLGAKIFRSLTDGRKCLYDKDDDGIAETGFLIDDGTREDRTPQGIEPEDLNITEFREAGFGNHVVFELQKGSTPSFRINIVVNNKKLDFDKIVDRTSAENRFQKIPKKGALPLDHVMFGAHFTILSHDKRTGETTIDWPSGYESEMVSVPTEVTFVYTFY